MLYTNVNNKFFAQVSINRCSKLNFSIDETSRSIQQIIFGCSNVSHFPISIFITNRAVLQNIQIGSPKIVGLKDRKIYTQRQNTASVVSPDIIILSLHECDVVST